MITVQTEGRTDLVALFRTGLLQFSKLNHTPFLVFAVDGDVVNVRIVNSARKLAALPLPDETRALVQWRGEWSSDYFACTVGDVRHALRTLAAPATAP